MAFTDVEMAILSQLSYCGGDYANKKSSLNTRQPYRGESLHSYLTDPVTKEYLKSQLGSEYGDALEKLIAKVEDKDYVVVKADDDKKGTGFAAIAIKDPDNNVTVATRGTEGLNLRDISTDIQVGIAISTDQQMKMQLFMASLEKDGYDGYYFTGHSLGGNLAIYGATTLVPIDKVKGVVVFNAPGFNEAFRAKYSGEISRIYDKIKNYQNEYDYVSGIMSSVGQVIILESSKDGNHMGVDDHSLCNLDVDGDGFRLTKNQKKSIQTKILHYIVEGVRSLAGIKKIIMIQGIIEICVKYGRLAGKVLKSAAKSIKEALIGKKANNYGTLIQVDTAKLRVYADRLRSANKRIASLDKRMDALYLKVGLRDLFNLLQADLLTGSSRRLSNCAKYLDETANDFDTTERNIAKLF